MSALRYMSAIMLLLIAIFIYQNAYSADISINIVKPASGGLVGNTLAVAVTVNSLYELQNVKARVDTRETDLTFSNSAYTDKWGAHPGWSGTISMVGLTRGEKTLTVTATDILGGIAEIQGTFIYDQKPTLNVLAPLSETVARPQLYINATCTDDDSAGPVSITVKVENTGSMIATGKSSIDKTVQLKDYNGTKITLHFEALDSAGQSSVEDRNVYVESSIKLVEVESAGGRIWDVQPDLILFMESTGGGNTLKIRERATGQETVVMNEPEKKPQYGYLTPKGAIFLEQSGDVLTNILYDWRDGTLVNLGTLNSSTSLRVKGNYAIWNVQPKLILRDLITGLNTEIPDTQHIGNWMNDVAANGDVVYWTSGSEYNIFRYRTGSITQLTKDDSSIQNFYTLTDGINAVYLKNSSQTYSIAMYGEAGEAILAPAQSGQPEIGRDYQVNNGWIAFTKLGTNGQLHVWVRSPSGEEKQVTYFGSSSRINALGPNGEVTFINGNRLYLSSLNSDDIDIGSDLGQSFYQDGQWFVTIGRSLFKIDTTAKPSILVSPVNFDFSSVNVGSSSDLETITISNNGTANLLIDPITLTGTNASDFTIQNDTCSDQTIVPSGTCTIDVVFLPTSVGTENADLSIPSNDPDATTLAVSLSGTGIDTTAPNLKAKNIRLPKAVTRRRMLEIKATGENIGNEDAISFKVGFYLSSNNNKSVEGDTLLGEKSLSGIKRNKAKAGIYKWKVPKSLTVGSYYIKVLWDSENLISESDEKDNIGVSSQIKVR